MIPLPRHVLASALAVALCGLVLTAWACAPAVPTATRGLNGAALEPAVTLPSLTLTRTAGASFTTATARGRMSLFFFGYTHCADACPLTLAEFEQIRRGLGSDARNVDMY